MPILPASHTRLPSLDGLRGMSVLLVILSHSERYISLPPFQGHGLSGVAIFFVISGFIISSLLLKELAATGQVDIGAFYLRRAYRILPPILVYLSGCLLLAMVGLMPADASGSACTLLFLRNFSLCGGTWYTGHFWTLSLEEQFYLLWPLLLGLGFAGRWNYRRGVALGLLAAVLLVLVQAALHKWLLNSITRFLPFFLTGICLALFQGAITRQVNAMSATRIELAVAGALLVVALCPINDSRGLEAGTIAIPLLAVAAAVLIACGERSRIFRKLLGNPVLISIGMASFSLYIWQQLFFSPAAAVPWTAQLNLPLALGLAALCGTASYLLIEKNAQRLRLRSESRRRGLLDTPG